MNEDQPKAIERNFSKNLAPVNAPVTSRIFVATNPRGAESLPPGIVVKETDLYLRRLWGIPSEDLKTKPKYLVTFTVGWDQRDNIDAAVKKFSEDFQIVLFHYDGRTTEWDQYEWSKQAIHVSVTRQTKWWYAKRFMHPNIVAAYDYIFIWDEDLGVEHFNGDAYFSSFSIFASEICRYIPTREFDYVIMFQVSYEIIAPCFHGSIGDFTVDRASRGSFTWEPGSKSVTADYGWQGCTDEWHQFQDRLDNAEKAYLKEIGQGS
ncbi:hypothetical protein Tco_0724033 [Tanacetum coccineum]